MKIKDANGNVIHESVGFAEADVLQELAAQGLDTSTLTVEYNLLEIKNIRQPLLITADHMVNTAADQGDAPAEAKARTYRQALRDITNGVTGYTTLVLPTQPVA